jgi:hypothetical protein
MTLAIYLHLYLHQGTFLRQELVHLLIASLLHQTMGFEQKR